MLIKKSVFVVMLSGFMISQDAYGAYSQDSGKITELYANDSGGIAIHLENGFPNALSSAQCPSVSSNGSWWAGNLTAKSSLKAALMTAKAIGSNVVITINGCEAGGAWLKILDVYIR